MTRGKKNLLSVILLWNQCCNTAKPMEFGVFLKNKCREFKLFLSLWLKTVVAGRLCLIVAYLLYLYLSLSLPNKIFNHVDKYSVISTAITGGISINQVDNSRFMLFG